MSPKRIPNRKNQAPLEKLKSLPDAAEETSAGAVEPAEKLQSLNEELSTINAELRDKNDQLVKANDDLKNFLDRTDIAIIFLDEQLKIRSFTPASSEVFKLRTLDIGRPLEEITSRLAYDKVISDAREVLRTFQNREIEVQLKDQHWYTMRILPYRTVLNNISGLVLSFLDIDRQKRALNELDSANLDLQESLEESRKAAKSLQESEQRYHSLFENMIDGYAFCRIIYEDCQPMDFVYLDVNKSFEILTGLKNVIGKKVTQVIPGIQESNPELFNICGRVTSTGQSERFETYLEELKIWFSIAVYSTEKETFVAIFENITQRKNAEAEILHLASFPELNPNPIVELDANGLVKYLNPAARALFPDLESLGINHPFLTGLMDLILKVDTDSIVRDLNIGDSWYEQTLTRTSATRTYRLYCKNITRRKNAEQQLVEQSTMLANVNDAIIGYDADFRITYWNRVAEEIYGYSAAEALGKKGHMLLKPIYAAITREELVDLVMKKGHLETESVRSARDGRQLYVESHVIGLRDENGKLISYVAVDRDISGFKKAENDLLLVNRELGAISQCNQAMIRATDEVELFTEVCRIICDVAGYRMAWVGIVEHDEARSVRPWAWSGFEHGYLAEANITWADTELGGGPTGMAVRTAKTHFFQDFASEPAAAPWRDAALARGYRSSIALPLLDDDGNVFGVFSLYASQPNTFNTAEIHLLEELAGDLAFGVTALRARVARERADEALKESTEKLERYNTDLEFANKELEAFAYSVSHDLRQPLRAMDGFSEAVIKDYGDRLDETGKDYLNRVRQASQRMSDLINDLLKLSRLSRAEMYFQQVNLSDLAQSIIEEFQHTQPERKVEINISPGIIVNGDQSLLTIALQNLLGNSWKFTAKCHQAYIELGTTEQNGERVYFVRDNGVGFDMKYSSKLYQPFQRLHSDKDYEGTGIGLATVQRVIRRHGGRIWAESEKSKGSTFYFTLA